MGGSTRAGISGWLFASLLAAETVELVVVVVATVLTWGSKNSARAGAEQVVADIFLLTTSEGRVHVICTRTLPFRNPTQTSVSRDE